MYTNTVFNLVEVVLSVVVCLVFLSSYMKTKKPTTFSLALAFFWIALATFSYSLPVLMDKNDFKTLAYGYIIGTGLFYLVFFTGTRILLFLTKENAVKKVIIFFSRVLIPVAFLNIGIMFYDLRLPFALQNGMIDWNVNPVALWLFGMSCFAYGLLWWYTFSKSAALVVETYARQKLMIMGIVGALLGVSALIIRTSTTPSQVSTGHVVLVTAIAIACSIYFIPKKYHKS